MTIVDIISAYRDELREVEDKLREIFSSDSAAIRLIGDHIINSGGKRLRPLFLILSAELAGYHEKDRIILASIIEAIHTASLLHDDVVDGAEMRRGKPASHRIWGNQIAILVGDFLYANALRIAVLQKNQKIMEALSEATTMMTEGEVLQLQKIADPDITEGEYIRIISAKTGALISAACRIGAILGRLPTEAEEAMARFGMKTGIVFQMVDDILDYAAEAKDLGKNLGKDLDEGKITLPLIYLLKSASVDERTEIREIIRGNHSSEKLERVLNLFDKYSIIEESLRTAQIFMAEAKKELYTFPSSHGRDSLLSLADYAIARDK
ncbi:MAG: polyprenyl synthetase family protein [Thermodesulfovibrionales bacterium]